MKPYQVVDLMVPLSEYASVPEGTTLYDAILALEKVQMEYDHTKYRHRAVLVLDKNKRVIGKLGQLDVLRALEPAMEDEDTMRNLDQFGFSLGFMRSLRNRRRVEKTSLEELCRNAAKLKVEEFMQATDAGEYIEAQASLDLAINQLVLGHHLSLLVTRDQKIVGILRLSDVFAAVFHTMKKFEGSL